MNAEMMLLFDIGDKGEGRLYADIQADKLNRFAGELCFRNRINFQEAAGLFGGDFVCPPKLEQQGFDIGQHVEGRAAVYYLISDGSFGVTVSFSKDWDGRYGQGKFCIEKMKGSVQYRADGGKKSGQYEIFLSGTFRLGGQYAQATLKLQVTGGETDTAQRRLDEGTPKAETVITLRFGSIELADFIDSISGMNSYTSLPLPQQYAKPEKIFSLEATLNLTEQSFSLWGTYQFKEKSGLTFMLRFSKQNGQYTWWMGLQLQCFSLSDISDSLNGAEEFLGLGEIEGAVFLSSVRQTITVPDDRPLPQMNHEAWNGGAGPVCQEGKGERELLLDRGLTFRIRLVLTDSFLQNVWDMQGDCILSGFIPAEPGQRISLCGYVDQITFLGFLCITELNVKIEKQGNGGEFVFSAAGNLQISFPKLTLPEFMVNIVYEKTSKHKKIKLTGKIGTIKEPLGIPQTTLEEVSFCAMSESVQEVEKALEKENITETVYFAGKVSISDVTLSASILFSERQPKVVEVRVGDGEKQKLSISGLVRKYCGVEWVDILDIQLYNGRIWYCAGQSAVILNGVVYWPGLCAQLDTKIFFLPECTLSLGWNEENNLSAAARIKDEINLAFVRFYLQEQGEHVVTGPEVSIAVSKKKSTREFKLHTSVEMLSKKIGDIDIKVRKKNMEGEIDFKGDFFLHGKIGFIMDETGFHLKGSEFYKQPNVNMKIPNMKPGNGSCKVRILESPEIKTKLKITSKGINLDKEQLAIKFCVIIKFNSESVFSKEGGEEFAEIPFDDLEVTIKKEDCSSLSCEKFLKILGENIKNIGADIFEQAISLKCFDHIMTEEGMKKLIKFLTIEGITWGINELVSYLICQGLKEALAKSLVGALTSVLSSEWEGMVGMASIALSLVGLFGVIDTEGNYTVGKRAPEACGEGSENGPAVPEAPMLSFEEDVLKICWKACDRADGYYPIVTEKSASGETFQLALGGCEDTGAGEYQFDVRVIDEENINDSYGKQRLYRVATGNEYQIGVYAWNQEGAVKGKDASVYLLKRPENIRVRYFCMEKRLCITWDEVERADEYEVESVCKRRGEKQQETAVKKRAEEKRQIEMQQEPDRAVTVMVRGKAGTVTGPAAVFGALWLYDIQAPENISSYPANEGIVVEWERVSFADRYRVICCDAVGNRVDVQEVAESATLVRLDKLAEHISYRITVQPMTEEIEGRVSRAVSILWKQLCVPEILEVICREDGLVTVVWETDDDRYRQLLYPDGRVLTLDARHISCEWSRGEKAKLRLVEPFRQGQWSRPVSLEVVPMPKNVGACIQGKKLCITWEHPGVDADHTYGVELMTRDGHRVVEPLDGTCWQTELSDREAEASVRVCLYTIDEADRRRRSGAVEISLN